jgi:hypothetical protein
MKPLLALTAAAVTAAALAVSPALANPGYQRPDNRAVGPRSDPTTAVVSASGFGHVRPDDRANNHGPGRAPATTATTIVVRDTHPGFGWGDAAIGAAGGAGLVLLVLGAALLVRRARVEPRLA